MSLNTKALCVVFQIPSMKSILPFFLFWKKKKKTYDFIAYSPCSLSQILSKIKKILFYQWSMNETKTIFNSMKTFQMNKYPLLFIQKVKKKMFLFLFIFFLNQNKVFSLSLVSKYWRSWGQNGKTIFIFLNDCVWQFFWLNSTILCFVRFVNWFLNLDYFQIQSPSFPFVFFSLKLFIIYDLSINSELYNILSLFILFFFFLLL